LIKGRNRVAFLIALALVITIILIFAFSPAVRAAMETILVFNGVTVSVDQNTGKLVISGNMDAVVDQTDYSVEIKGENGDFAGAGIATAQTYESVDVSDLLINHSDLSLPAVPTGYLLLPQGELVGSSMTFTWHDTSGNMITYQRSPATLLEGAPGSQERSSELPTASDGQSIPLIHYGNGFLGNNDYSGPILTYDWEAGGYLHELIITDTSMNETDLQAMLP
jgi:hypothetical protein